MRPGRFIALEGIDGSGKSTQVGLLAGALIERGLVVRTTREPGGTALGERLRTLLLDESVPIDPRAEALLFAAARAQHVRELILPALAIGEWVVCDRFLHSSLAYQGAARGLGIDAVRAANALAVEGALPDLVVVIDVPVAVAVDRSAGAPDRIESEGDDLQRAVAAGYRTLARAEPARVRLVSGEGTAEEVHRRVLALVDGLG